MEVQGNPPTDKLPKFTCRIEGQAIFIDSENCPALFVLPGEEGLGLQGDVIIKWNAKRAYIGPVQPVMLGDFDKRLMGRLLYMLNNQ